MLKINFQWIYSSLYGTWCWIVSYVFIIQQFSLLLFTEIIQQILIYESWNILWMHSVADLLANWSIYSEQQADEREAYFFSKLFFSVTSLGMPGRVNKYMSWKSIMFACGLVGLYRLFIVDFVRDLLKINVWIFFFDCYPPLMRWM